MRRRMSKGLRRREEVGEGEMRQKPDPREKENAVSVMLFLSMCKPAFHSNFLREAGSCLLQF